MNWKKLGIIVYSRTDNNGWECKHVLCIWLYRNRLWRGTDCIYVIVCVNEYKVYVCKQVDHCQQNAIQYNPKVPAPPWEEILQGSFSRDSKLCRTWYDYFCPHNNPFWDPSTHPYKHLLIFSKYNAPHFSDNYLQPYRTLESSWNSLIPSAFLGVSLKRAVVTGSLS